jgi:hypothetical protein
MQDKEEEEDLISQTAAETKKKLGCCLGSSASKAGPTNSIFYLVPWSDVVV